MNLKQMLRGLADLRHKPKRSIRPAGDLGSHWDDLLERALPSPLGKEIVEVDAHINDESFARAAASCLLELINQSRGEVLGAERAGAGAV